MKTVSLGFLGIMFLSSFAVDRPRFESGYISTLLPTISASFAAESMDSLLIEKYKLAKSLLLTNDEGSLDHARRSLEAVVSMDPRLEGALTLLGTAYYRLGRYQHAYQILQRAVAIKNDDEIGWLLLGLAQLRIGQDQKGIETLKGAVTLLSKVSKSGYRGFPNWDSRSRIQAAFRRTAFTLVNVGKGSAQNDDVVSSTELLLLRVDEEELEQLGKTPGTTPAK